MYTEILSFSTSSDLSSASFNLFLATKTRLPPFEAWIFASSIPIPLEAPVINAVYAIISL